MALKVSKVVYKGKAAREKNKERVRTSKLPKKRVKVEGELRPAISFPNLTVYIDDTVKKLIVPKFETPLIVSDVFEGLIIDSNYRIMFSSNEISRYENLTSTLLSIFVVVDSTRYKLTRESGVESYVPLFTRVDIGEREFLITMNPLFGVVVYDEKLVIMRRDKKSSRYSIRLENLLREYESGRVEMKLFTLVHKINASSSYAKSFGQFDGRVLREAVETINTNGNGVTIKDYGRGEEDVVWFEIEVEK